ncbi:unannotated protein [freshwater metagenome]|uniref:Unannotated protein n=1 Tax=freshwater metagenome TaxID=449393 RepID=A0A6J7DQG3_9ZZZZ|nr:DUF3027 domain-containing protein [Actinomycetota bacterium]
MSKTFDAQDIARDAALADAEFASQVGVFVSVDYADENRVASYLFEADLPGYKGWRWCVTVAKVDDDSAPTVCDVVVLPGPDSLLAPEWIEYRDRIQPEDIQPGIIVPSALDDTRLVPGVNALVQDEELDAVQVFDLGLSRPRVLSIEGRDQASKRWYAGDRGPNTPLAQGAPKPCASCGFFIPIAGSMRSAFGVCANAIAPDDARVVSVDHGCGAHSEATL